MFDYQRAPQRLNKPIVLLIRDQPPTTSEQILVGGITTPLKNMKANWDDDIPYIWKNKSHVPVTTNQILITINHYINPH